jgi:ubiquinone/menaquinone biosynthesis C-methylase UbiE
MSELLEAAGKRFARLTARAVVAQPRLWGLFRGAVRKQFDSLAPVWDERVGADAPAALVAALDRLERPPRRALDLGTGTGRGAVLLAERYRDAEVVGVDLAPAMVAEARRLAPPELEGRLTFEVADAAELPFPDDSFDLVLLMNMIPFFPEIRRVTAPGGTVVVTFGYGSDTPIWTPSETLRARLAPLGFDGFEDFAVGTATALLAKRPEPG